MKRLIVDTLIFRCNSCYYYTDIGEDNESCHTCNHPQLSESKLIDIDVYETVPDWCLLDDAGNGDEVLITILSE